MTRRDDAPRRGQAPPGRPVDELARPARPRATVTASTARRGGLLRALLADRRALRRQMLLREVLGPPKALE